MKYGLFALVCSPSANKPTILPEFIFTPSELSSTTRVPLGVLVACFSPEEVQTSHHRQGTTFYRREHFMYFIQITRSQSFSRGKRVESSRVRTNSGLVPPVSSYKTFSRIRILTLFILFHLPEHWRARGGRCELKMVQSKENICKAPRTHSSSCDREEEQQLVESSSSKYCECPSYLCINTQWHQEITPWLPS